jgi:Flp pilus assembly protein TadD
MKKCGQNGVMRQLACVLLGLFTGCTTTTNTDFALSRDSQPEATSDSEEPSDAKTLFAMARVLILRERPDQAEVVLVRLVNEYPRFVPAYSELGELRLQQGRVEDAKYVLKHASARFPQEHILLNNLAICHLVSGEYQDALTMLEAALVLQPVNERYLTNKALVLGLLGRREEARELYTRTVGAENAEVNMEHINTYFKHPGSSPLPSETQLIF